MFLAAGALLHWRGHPALGATLAPAGALLVLGGLLRQRWLTRVERGWMRAATALGGLNARLLLVIAYYALLTPAGLVLRLRGRDPLDRRLRTAESYWHPRTAEPPSSRERYLRQY
jgi:hypothetical protein